MKETSKNDGRRADSDQIPRSILDALPGMVIVTDGEGRVTIANRAADLLVGDEAEPFEARILNLTWHGDVEDDHARNGASIRFGAGNVREKHGETAPYRIRLATMANGSALWMLSGYDGHQDDEADKRHMQKLDSLGRLAGGIAHEFNNSLAALKTYAFLIESSGDTASAEYAAQMNEAIDAATSFTGDLLSFARKNKSAPRLCSLNDQIQSVLPMLTRVLGERVTIESSLASDLPLAWFDPGLLVQIELNLGLNASHAMAKGGKLSLQSGTLEVEDGDCRLGGRAGPQTFVTLRVSDNGAGMASDVVSGVFDPFFTTRGSARGTGLGLSVVHGIVMQLNGFIDVSSRPGHGTSFLVGFLSAESVPDDQAAPAPVVDRSNPGPIEANILLVEDETLVRESLRKMLVAAGYHVKAAPDGESSCAISDDDLRDFDLVISDLVMPGMDGIECVAQLRRRHAGLPAIFITGHSARGLVDDDELSDPMVIKPFDPEEFLGLVAETCRS